MPIKAGSSRGLSNKIDKSIMPFLQSEKGFQTGTTLVNPDRLIAISDTHWETKEDAESYQQTGYLKVLDMLSEFVIKAPKDSIFEVLNSSNFPTIIAQPLNRYPKNQ
jgi:hypothetical protein